MSTAQNIPSTPLVSFIVTAYNLPAAFLRESVASILRLTLTAKEREVIVIDDGSLPPCQGDLDEFADDIIYLRQPNRGLSCARNMGLKVASGKFIQFVDGDDSLLAAPYNHCVDIMRYHNPDIVMFDYTQKPQADTPFTFEGPMSGGNFMRNHNIRGSVWGYAFRRDILGTLRFTPGILHEDEEFAPLLLLRSESLYVTDAKAYFYRKRAESIVHEKASHHKERRIADTLKVICRLKELSRNLPELERAALQRRIAQLSMDYLHNVILLFHSHKRLNEAIKALEENELYPLPDKKYTRKYTCFRRLVQSNVGRGILMAVIR